MTHCKHTTVRFNKALPAEKSLGKLHLNLDWRLVSAPLLFLTLDRLSFTCAAHWNAVKIFLHANKFCATVPHIFAVIVRVIETDAY